MESAIKRCFIIFILFNSFSIFAQDKDGFARRSWKKILIPNAVCGDGAPYHVFLDTKNSSKLAFDFMGGGVCWNRSSCVGPNLRTWIHPIPVVLESSGFVSTNPDKSPVSDASMVFFPYCNGDLHLGTFKARYGKFSVNHHGKLNVVNAVKYLQEQKLIDFAPVEEFTIYGYSAGALGSLYHSIWLDRVVPKDAKRVLIVDSPGLHFGPRFLDEFSPRYVQDLQAVFDEIGDRVYYGNGRLARIIPQFCKKMSNWKMLYLQSTKDIVMSNIFGKLSIADHERMVRSEDGIINLTKNPFDNCVSFVPNSPMHTFLVDDLTGLVKANGKTATQFVLDAFKTNDLRSYTE